jgi:hypothetical protein
MEDSSIEDWPPLLFLERVGKETIFEQLGSINKLNEGARPPSTPLTTHKWEGVLPPQLRCDSCTTLNNDDRFVHVSSKRDKNTTIKTHWSTNFIAHLIFNHECHRTNAAGKNWSWLNFKYTSEYW